MLFIFITRHAAPESRPGFNHKKIKEIIMINFSENMDIPPKPEIQAVFTSESNAETITAMLAKVNVTPSFKKRNFEYFQQYAKRIAKEAGRPISPEELKNLYYLYRKESGRFMYSKSELERCLPVR